GVPYLLFINPSTACCGIASLQVLARNPTCRTSLYGTSLPITPFLYNLAGFNNNYYYFILTIISLNFLLQEITLYSFYPKILFSL
ncbi:MAG TPA: hypothetical protein PK348_08375, partial [Spirochaetota bacterium]|nr:hypothetical protein [Spirochaetota bacterium]